jgi:hypothetical protein
MGATVSAVWAWALRWLLVWLHELGQGPLWNSRLHGEEDEEEMRYWKLVGKRAVPVADPLEWTVWFESADRVVAQDETNQGAHVSTIFLGLDHNFGGGTPILFETMVWFDGNDVEQHRYSTWEEAEAGHKRMVEKFTQPVVH